MSDQRNRLTAALSAALDAMGDAKVPSDLREIAFAKSIDFVLSDGFVSSASGIKKQTNPDPAAAGGSVASGVGKIAMQLGVEDDLVERVFEVDGDDIHVVVARKALANTKRGAQKEIAYLVTAARQAVGLDEVTASATVRAVCEHFGVLDGNFGFALNDISGKGLRISGSGQSRTLKINKTGYEAAAEIIARIGSGAAK